MGALPKSPLRWRESRYRSPVDRGKQGIKRSTRSSMAAGHPTRSHRGSGQPPRLTASEGDPGHPAGGAWNAARAERDERAPGAGLRLRDYPRETVLLPRLHPRDLRKKVSLHRYRPQNVLGGRANQLVAQRPQEALVWCTERREGGSSTSGSPISDVLIIERRLIREAWSRYRWKTRPSTRP